VNTSVPSHNLQLETDARRHFSKSFRGATHATGVTVSEPCPVPCAEPTQPTDRSPLIAEGNNSWEGLEVPMGMRRTVSRRAAVNGPPARGERPNPTSHEPAPCPGSMFAFAGENRLQQRIGAVSGFAIATRPPASRPMLASDRTRDPSMAAAGRTDGSHRVVGRPGNLLHRYVERPQGETICSLNLHSMLGNQHRCPLAG